MTRSFVTTEDAARAGLDANRSKPVWREGRVPLPLHELTPGEFEVFCFLLVKREHPRDKIELYGSSGDAGRDIVHRVAAPDGVVVRLIQCKRYDKNVGVSVVGPDLAKVWVNVLSGAIPERPDELAFYVVPELTTDAKDLLGYQSVWHKAAPAALKKYLQADASAELLHHAAEWWPTPSSQGALVLTERARKYPDLVEEFFGVRKVIDGTVADVTAGVRALVTPRFDCLDDRLGRVEQLVAAPPPAVPMSVGDLNLAFARTSAGLLRWPTTVSGGRWLDRPELQELYDRVTSSARSASVVLGPPGGGKSALLARRGHRHVGQGIAVLAVKADQLPARVDSAGKLAEWLGLPVEAAQAVLAVACGERVVVLFDQLDALADLTDLKSERLHVVLNLVARLGGRAGVHVVCSCRAFEFRHDGRLSRLDALEVNLQAPPWCVVSGVLTAHKVPADGWPDDAKALLRVPQHLAVFLKTLTGTGEQRYFTTYQQLFNDLWRREVASAPARAELVHDLADRLADAEELWLDRGRYDDRPGVVAALVAADVLCLTPEGFRLGFRHQMLFEFARAKAFAQRGVSLSAHVLARQDGLFVRPTLWMALNYLRDADGAAYRREFEALWGTPYLRRHVRHLLLDFLAQAEQPAPSDWEQARMLSALRDPAWRRKVLTALIGKPVWFGLWATTYLGAEMLKSPAEAADVIWVLVAASRAERDRCLDLMARHWLPDDAKLHLVWRALNNLDDWNEAATGQAVAIVRQLAIDRDALWHLVQWVAKTAPRDAVRLFAAWLSAERLRVTSSADDSGGGRADRLRKLLDGRTHWYAIDTLAARVPAEFVRSLWPALTAIIHDLGGTSSGDRIQYDDNGLSFAKLDSREFAAHDTPDELTQALDVSTRAVARAEPAAFAAFVQDFGNPDSMFLQRIACRGVREVAAANPTLAFKFLTGDSRRFWLGGLHDDQGDSIELIESAGAHLTSGQVTRLTRAILAWEVYRPRDGEPDGQGNVYARGARFRLLMALPLEGLPEDVRLLLDADRLELPEHTRSARPLRGAGMHQIVSPVSHVEMASQSDEEILGLFDRLHDATGGHDPRDWMRGGSQQASGEFRDFAKLHPVRAAAVLTRLRHADQQRPAAYGVQGLAEAGRPVAEVVELVRRLDERGFTGQEFRATVASALSSLGRPKGLPESACELLERWRVADWPGDRPGAHQVEARDAARYPSSIVWGPDSVVSLSHGRFSVLDALTVGYLHRKPHAASRWLEMLRDHVEREETEVNWRVMCLDLSDVRWCPDQAAAGEFLERLFGRFQGVLTCEHGVRLLADVAHLLSDEACRAAYGTVRMWDAERGPQAFGELVGLRHLLDPEDTWAAGQVEAAYAAAPTAGREWVLVGVAFAAVNQWHTPGCRGRATALLCRLVLEVSERVGFAAMTAFRTRDDLPMDDSTLAVFGQVRDHPEVLTRCDVDEAFFEHLLDAFVVDTELVCAVSEQAVRLLGTGLQSAHCGVSLASPALIDVALRLQRGGGEYRRRGIDLFEALLDLGVSEAVGVAASNDLRLTPGGHPVRIPRRTRSTPTAS